jgi:hypothetical protein
MAGKGAAWKTTISLAKTTATRSSRSRLLRIPRKAKTRADDDPQAD